ncbi:MAG: NAD-dependent epimerase/dehydratase family protein, partial [Chloroflexi bacterium]|nr:NAD-dependent epimerase/dehydratase family protein [Chloroflexota bacterium]
MSGNGSFWADKRVCVTGGGGFLGSYVIERLGEQGAADIVIPRKRDYDLVDGAAVRRMLGDVRPQIVLHLAANVGGIGANREHPAEFFYDNLMMGVQLLHESWRNGVEKFVAVGTVCSYPKFTPVPFKEVDFWGGYPEETNAPYGLAKKMLLVQSQSYRQQYGFNSIYLIP